MRNPEETARGAKPSKLLIEIEGLTFVISELSATSDPRLSTGSLHADGDFGPELPLPPTPILSHRVPFVSVWATPSHALIENVPAIQTTASPAIPGPRHFRSKLTVAQRLRLAV